MKPDGGGENVQESRGNGTWNSFSGEIVSGKGEGRHFVELTWVKDQITSKVGFVPYPGTFNVKIADDAGKEAVKKMRRSIAKAITIIPPGGRGCSGSCFVAKIADAINAAVIVPSEGGYMDILELVAPVLVKDALGLSDGNTVRVQVYIPDVGRE